MMKSEVETKIRAIFKANMKIFDLDIPENNDLESAQLIINVMHEAIGKLKQEIESGNFDNY